MKYQTHTFGCKVNTYDTGLIQKNLARGGFIQQSPAEDPPRIHVLNTCAVTAEATKEAVKLIRRLKIQDPFCTIVVTGCAAQVDTDQFQNLAGADLVVANSHKSQLPELLKDYFKGNLKDQRVFKSNIFKKEDLEMGGGLEKSHTRSFLKIQDGCNSFCSFCIIPYARGKSRSISIRDLTNKVNELYFSGHREVVLTGVHIGDYEDGDKKIEDLVEHLLRHTPMPRFRLSSLEPIELSDRLIELYQEPRLCPHFHMSIQSANTEVLKQMKRKYSQQEVRKSLLQIEKRVKNAFVGMDVIAGFPTETLEQFEDTYLALADLPWTRLHVFPYSERKGTRAETFEQISYGERKNRATRLRELSAAKYQERGETQVGQIQQALVLKQSAKGSQALTREYWPVRLPDLDLEKIKGQEVNVKLNRFVWNGGSGQDGYLEGNII